MNPQPKALVLADALEELDVQFSHTGLCAEAAAELRRLHERCEQWRDIHDAVVADSDKLYAVLRQALEALEKVITAFGPGLTLQQKAATALRQALVDVDDTSQERVDEIVTDEHEPVVNIVTGLRPK
jgi:hypothetical protein